MLLVFPEGAVYINKLKLTMRYLSSLAGLLCGYFNVLSEPWVGSQLRALSIQPPLAGGRYSRCLLFTPGGSATELWPPLSDLPMQADTVRAQVRQTGRAATRWHFWSLRCLQTQLAS